MRSLPHLARNGGIASAVVVAVVAVAGFMYSVPVTTAVAFPVLVVNTNTVTYTTNSTTQVPVTNQVPITQAVFSIASVNLRPDHFTSSSAQLAAGSDVGVTWSSGDTVDVYVFDSAQYSIYAQNFTTSPNIASQTGLASGSLGWHVTFSDTYYLVLHNPHSANIQVTAHGSDTYLGYQTTYISQVATYTTSSEILFSSTGTSTTTKSCSYIFWSWAFGSRSCP